MSTTTTLSTTGLTERFLDFYRERGHTRIEGSTLLTRPDDPVLFTSAGMHPLVDNLVGRPHPLGRRLTNRQRCLRTTDLDEVGDGTHLTVFDMLGSWSLGDYPGPQSLRWGYELLTDGLGIDRRRLHATAFGGNHEVPPDDDSSRTWDELGVPVEPTETENWWSNGPTGPCGPDSEIFCWTGDGPPVGTPTTDQRWVEIWNHVMMRFVRHTDGSLQPLDRPSVDTGMGLERMSRILQGVDSVYDIDVFRPWDVLPWSLPLTTRRILIDHLRSAVVVLGDGVRPSNTGRGYVLRKLVRRALTSLWDVDRSYSLVDLPVDLVDHTLDVFGQLGDPHELRTLLLDEERRFGALLDRGRSVIARLCSRGPLTEDDFFTLHDTYGLPGDLVRTLLDSPVPSES